MGSPGIAINASVVGAHPTGLGLYAIHLVRHLQRIRPDLAVYTSAPAAFDFLRAPATRLSSVVRPERGGLGHVARLVWTQIVLPVRTRRARVLLNTVPEGPIRGGPPQVTVVHDLLPLAFPAEYPRQQYYFRHFVPRVLGRARVVVADSESTAGEISRRFALPAGKVRVVYPGFDPERFFQAGDPAPPSPDPPYLLYVGNLLPHKNLVRLVEAFALVRRVASCRLVIRGSGRPSYARALRARIEELGLSPAVSFVDYAADDALRRLYAGATCLVLPSLAEGFGLPILEAMASGTPVVTSSTSSLAEVAGGAALTVDPRDVGGLADVLGMVLQKPELRAELRRRGLERVRCFSWQRTAAEISALIDGIPP